jgi:hypothetical protein
MAVIFGELLTAREDLTRDRLAGETSVTERTRNIPRALAKVRPAGPHPTMTTPLSQNSLLVKELRRKFDLRQSVFGKHHGAE